jgi:hypothetical protein
MPHLYDTIGIGYRALRRPDPRVAAAIVNALGPAASLVNVGAGAGSYEPADRRVVAVEPSREMIRQRPAGAAPVLQAFLTRSELDLGYRLVVAKTPPPSGSWAGCGAVR